MFSPEKMKKIVFVLLVAIALADGDCCLMKSQIDCNYFVCDCVADKSNRCFLRSSV